MASSHGPRDYTAGTERALYAYAGTTCYFPDCSRPVIVFVNDEPVCDMEIAHICGAKPGSARYDPSMTDEERRHFSNLILLCKPHHKTVDSLHPDDYPAHLLRQWKTEHERKAGIDLGALSGLTEDRLIDLLEKAIGSAGPTRVVTAQIGLGVLASTGFITLQPDTAKDYFARYAEYGPAVVILTARNTGAMKASIATHKIKFAPAGFGLQMFDEFPLHNPRLPHSLDSGASASWFYALSGEVSTMMRFLPAQGYRPEHLVGEFELGSGEIIKSGPLPVKYLGLGP
jgi:hypothetical protein